MDRLRGPQFSNMEMEALREAGNIGVGRAATVLSQVLATRVEMTVPRAQIREVWDALELAGGREQLVAALCLRFCGQLKGNLLLFFDEKAASSLLERMLNKPISPLLELNELERSALEELGNMMLANFLTALSEFSGLYIRPMIPLLAIDMAGAILQEILVQNGQSCDHALLITTDIVESQGGAQGQIMILPEARQLEILLKALGVGREA